jgi:phospholipid/cholesterol/gamma-HCH transport system permease protein
MKYQDETLYFTGPLTKYNVDSYYIRLFKSRHIQKISRIDLTEVTDIDSAGAVFIEEIRKRFSKENVFVCAPGEIAEIIKLHTHREPSPELKNEKAVSGRSFITSLGEKAYGAFSTGASIFMMTVDLFFLGFGGLFTRKGRRKGDVGDECLEIGLGAVPVVMVFSLIIGIILTLQAAAQLEPIGGNVFVADLLAVSLVREMGPVFIAIILAGRTGSAITSELGSMKVDEELDALEMMGISPIRFLLVPKYYAMLISLPLLTVFGDVTGILSGLVVANITLDLNPGLYLERVAATLDFWDILHGFAKVPFFAWVIVAISGHFGFTVSGGAAGVGRATTKAVVSSIFSVIFIDVLFSVIYIFQ